MSFLRLFFWVSPLAVIGQPLAQTDLGITLNATYNHKLFTVEDGLSQGYITCLHEDREGYLWVGTLSGLNRFDGKNFESFIENPNDSFSVKGQYVDQILEDHLQRTWVLFNNGSIAVFDEETERFHTVELIGYEEHEDLNYLRIFRHEEHLWIRQTNKIGRIILRNQEEHRATWKAEVSYVTVVDEEGEQPVRMRDLVFDEKGKLWLSAIKNVFVIDEPYRSDTLRARTFQWIRPTTEIDQFSLLEEGAESFWISNSLGELVRVRKEAIVEQLYFEPNHANFGIRSIVRDVNTILWLSTWGHAALYYSEEGLFQETDFESTCLLQTKDGTIWSGTDGYGLYRFLPQSSPFSNVGHDGYGMHPGEEMVAGPLTKSNTGELLMLADNVLRLDSETGRWVPHLDGFPEIEGGQSIQTYLEDSQGRVWFVVRGGTIYCKEVDGSVRSYKNDSTFRFSGLDGIFEDGEKSIWFINSKSLLSFNSEEQDFEIYPYQIENPPPREYSFNDFIDHSGNLWLATEMGLFLFDKTRKEFSQTRIEINGAMLEDVAFSALHVDQRDSTKIWVGTKNKGLFLYDVVQEKWTVLSQRNGLTNNTIYGIAQDEFNRTWVSTNAGVFVFNPEEGNWMNFRKENGIQGNEFNSRSFVQMADGRIYMGGMNGVTGFYPSDIHRQEQEFPIVLKSFSYEVQMGDSTQVNYLVDIETGVKLPYRDARSLGFEFAWLYYNQSENHRYAYRLGVEGKWVDLGNQNQLNFYDLGAGEYQLQVKATDWMGNVNQSILAVPFTILAPWYETGWAIAVYVGIGIALMVLVFRVREKRRRLEMEAVFNRNEAERFKDLEQTKSRFFANITHELKTPLTLVIGPLEQLHERAQSDSDKSMIHRVRQNASDLLYLINQLLDLNKVEQGKMPIAYSKGDLALFVKNIASKSGHLADSKDIRLEVQCTPETIEATFDSRKLERIVINLLSNALKFSPKNTTVEVTVEQHTDFILLQVKDEGPGIPPDKLESVFDAFYQLDGSEKRKHGGTGIGLSLVREYTELLGGTVSVRNNPGVGCTFEVVLPSAEVEVAPQLDYDIDISGLNVESNPSPVPSVVEPAEEGTPLILIAEDNEELNNYLKDCLGKYSVIQAYNGHQAWELIQEHLPDLILSDNTMPEMTGVELCAKVKESDLTSHIPVVILTAKSALESKVEGLSAGADDYLTKPFNQAELLIRVENLISLRKALREKYESTMQSVKVAKKDQALNVRDRAFIEKAEAIIEANLDNGEFDVTEFVDALSISRSQAHRKFKALTNVSVSVFIRSYRLKRAMQMMQTEGLIVKEAAYRTGFNSPSYFSKCFADQFGIPPTQILN